MATDRPSTDQKSCSAAPLSSTRTSHSASAKPVEQSGRLLLTETLLHVAHSADSLTHHVRRMAGRIYTRADLFPARESRIQQHLQRQTVIADAQDLHILQQALRRAEHATTDLAHSTLQDSGPHLGHPPYPLTDPRTAPPIQPSPHLHTPPR